VPSPAALKTVADRYPTPVNDREAAHRHRLAQIEERLLRYRAECAEPRAITKQQNGPRQWDAC
jgi:hypothetical protein